MNLEQQILYYDKNYTILSAEHEFIIHPSALGILPLSAEALSRSFSCSYRLDNYYLYLTELTLTDGRNENSSAVFAASESPVEFTDKKLLYSGAVLIGCTPVKDYDAKGYGSMFFAYKNVYELIFENGYLKTSIDHGKAMLRIRRNIELGLRCLTDKRDTKCINRFMKTTFFGNYKPFSSSKKRLAYLKNMKAKY
jgi:hypothetical protein